MTFGSISIGEQRSNLRSSGLIFGAALMERGTPIRISTANRPIMWSGAPESMVSDCAPLNSLKKVKGFP